MSDAEWTILAPLLEPSSRRGRPRKHDRRTVLNAVLYVLRGGVPWRLLPRESLPWLECLRPVLALAQKRRLAARERWLTCLLGRAWPPRTAIIDSQTDRTSEADGERGYDGGKRVSGRKRHLVVDSQGLGLHVCVHPADVHDRRGGEHVLYPAIDRLYADRGYQGLERWLEAELGWRLMIVKRPPRRFRLLPGQEPPPIPTGFNVLPKRWVVERTFAWLIRNRRRAKDWEQLSATTEAWIYLAMSRLVTKRLAHAEV